MVLNIYYGSNFRYGRTLVVAILTIRIQAHWIWTLMKWNRVERRSPHGDYRLTHHIALLSSSFRGEMEGDWIPSDDWILENNRIEMEELQQLEEVEDHSSDDNCRSFSSSSSLILILDFLFST